MDGPDSVNMGRHYCMILNHLMLICYSGLGRRPLAVAADARHQRGLALVGRPRPARQHLGAAPLAALRRPRVPAVHGRRLAARAGGVAIHVQPIQIDKISCKRRFTTLFYKRFAKVYSLTLPYFHGKLGEF